MNTPAQEKPRLLKQYLLVIGSFVVGIFLLVVIADKFIMPIIIHSSSTVVVPNFVGMSQDEAKVLIAERGLQVAGIREVYSDALARGSIANQLPYPGAEVKEGRRIYLSVSKGKEILKMPRLLGLTMRDARLGLMRIGLQIGSITYEFSESVEKDKVMSQSFPIDYNVHYGESVDIVISKGSERQITMPNVEGLTLDEAKQTLDDAGILYAVEYEKNGTLLANTVIAQQPAAGESLQPTTKALLTVVKE